MKINSIKTSTGYLHKGRGIERSLNYERECASERVNLKQNNNDQINTTIERNSDGRVSFKGGVPLLHRMANYTKSNPIVAEALFAILITCALRPATIMATAKSEEDRSKCTYQAAKSVSTGVVGLGMSALVYNNLSPLIKKVKPAIPEDVKAASLEKVKKGVEAITQYVDDIAKQTGVEESFIGQLRDLTKGGKINVGIFKDMGKGAEKAFAEKLTRRAPEVGKKYLDAAKAQKVLNNYSDTASNVLNKFLQPVFMPVRAAITIALVPVILNALGIKKGGSKKAQEAAAQQNKQVPQQQASPYDTLQTQMFQSTSEKEIFNSFLEVANNENQ